MADVVAAEGRCLCGYVSYRVLAAPADCTICHCNSCRRASGAQSVAWATFRMSEVEIAEGRLTFYESSPSVRRGFCSRCGTTLTFEAPFMDGWIDVTIASLDSPEMWPPGAHIWDEHRLAWDVPGDDLEVHAKFTPRSDG